MRGLRRLDLEEEAQLAKAMSNGGLVEVRSGVSMARGEKNRMAELCSEESFCLFHSKRIHAIYLFKKRTKDKEHVINIRKSTTVGGSH